LHGIPFDKNKNGCPRREQPLSKKRIRSKRAVTEASNKNKVTTGIGIDEHLGAPPLTKIRVTALIVVVAPSPVKAVARPPAAPLNPIRRPGAFPLNSCRPRMCRV